MKYMLRWLEKVNCKIFNLEEHCINYVEWLWNSGHVDTNDLQCCYCQTSLCPPPIQIAISSMSYLKGVLAANSFPNPPKF